eukprot:CCRYP_014533-RB/>CCRYP_014533-RB protein AED:0.07 eAED:0.07 QI:14/1/1/1/1/1/5/86/847
MFRRASWREEEVVTERPLSPSSFLRNELYSSDNNMIIIDPTMKSTPSTATALASNRRKLRLAGRSSSYVSSHANQQPQQPHKEQSEPQQQQQQQQADAEHPARTPSSTSQSSALSAVARRRLIRANPSQQRQQTAQESTVKETTHRQPQHLQEEPVALDSYREQQQPQQQQPPLSLNLHCTDSVDSDDNGTCFNSIGTTTPRQPSSNSSPRKSRDEQHSHQHDSSIMQQTHLHRDLQTTDTDVYESYQKSRYYDRDGRLSPLAEMSPSPRNDHANSRPSLVTPPHVTSQPLKESVWDYSSGYNHINSSNNNNNNISHSSKADNNSAYSEFDHRSVAENTKDGAVVNSGNMRKNHQQPPHATKQQRRGRSRTSRYEREKMNETSSVTSSAVGSSTVTRHDMMEEGYNNFMENHRTPGGQGGSAGTLDCKREGVAGVEGVGEEEEDFLNKPHVKAVIGVGAAATLCAAILGPVGFLVGIASAGIGMGVLQIPEEQRNNVCNHATTSLVKARDVALELSDTVSTSCGKCMGNENGADAAAEVRNAFIDRCCTGIDEKSRNTDDDGSLAWKEDGINGANEIKPISSSPMAAALNSGVHNVKGLVGEVFGEETPSPSNNNSARDSALLSPEEDGCRRVACGRKGRVVPASQIHSLRPSLQPRAWLDVMASAHTTREDKNEAMEEILILAKDKDISRWFLEEGILDSLMFILSSYFRNYSAFQRDEPPLSETKEPFESFKPGGNAFFHARLAANCCVALGKAHCAAVHTEGDLLLMSAYSRGSVPVERQLAQMLFEVPHHMKVIHPNQSNGSGGVTNDNTYDHAEFTLTELSMQQAEDLASSIKSLDDGNIDV